MRTVGHETIRTVRNVLSYKSYLNFKISLALERDATIVAVLVKFATNP